MGEEEIGMRDSGGRMKKMEDYLYEALEVREWVGLE